MAYKVSNKYKELRYSGDNDNQLYLEYNGVEVKDAPLKAEDLKWVRRILDNGSKTLTLDNFVSQTIELTIRDYEVSDTTKEFYIKIGSMVDGAYEYVPLGYYHIKDNPSTANGKTTYKLTDRSTNFDKYIDLSEFIKQNGGKITKLQAVQEYCRQCNVEFANTSFLGSNEEIGIYDNTITARVHIMYLAECSGCIATIGRDGKLYFIPFVKPNSNNTHIIPERILNNNMNNSKGSFKISKVVWEGALMPFEKGNDTGDTLFLNTSNPYISKQEDIDRIYNQVVGLEIDNINTSSIIGDPSIDPWDYIQYTHTDDNGNDKETYTSLAQYDMEFNGVFKQSFNTSIDREKKKINSTVNSQNAKVNRLKQEVDTVNASLKVTSEKIDQLELDTTTSKQAQGNPIEVNDAGEYNLESIGIDGKSYQDGTPTPTTPVEIKTVKGIRNLFDKDNEEINLYYTPGTGSINTQAPVWSQFNFIEAKPNKNYTLSSTYKEANNSFEITQFDSSNNWIKSEQLALTSGSYTFKTESNTKYIRIGSRNDRGVELNIQLEKGPIAHRYVPYGSWLEQITKDEDNNINTALIDMNKYDEEGNIIGYHELCSIGDTKDTFKDGELTKKIGKVVLDGNESYTWSIYKMTYGYAFDIGNPLAAIGDNSKITLLSDKFKASTFNDRNNGDVNIIYGYSGDSRIRILTNVATTVDEWKTWLSNNPVTVYYVLAEPQTYKLSYEQLKLFKGYNHITLNDELNPSMNIEYLTDSKLNAEFTTKSEFNISNNSIRESVSAEIKELDKKTEASLELKVNEKDMMSQINAKADEINFESDKMTIKCSDFELKNGKIKATGGTIGEWKLDGKGNLYSDYGNYRIYLQNAKVAGGDTWVLSSQIKNSAGNYSGAFILYANGDIESYKRIISHNSIFSDGNIVCGQIEVCNPFPYIDFHWNTTPNNYTDDYSTRIIEREYGVISFLNANGWANCRGGSWTNSSSRLVKKNIEEISEDEAKALLDLKAVSFDYKNGVTNNQRGFIAEDVLEVMKDYVYVPENYDETKFDNTEDENGNIDITQDVPSLDYSKFVVPLVKLCQMQQKQIDEQQKTINDLLERVSDLEKRQ